MNLLLVVGIGAVIIGSLLPGSSPAMTAVEKLPLTDKALHCLAYLTLSTLAALAHPRLRTSIVFVIALTLLGAALELLQGLVPGRTPEVADEAANVLGIFFGTILGHIGGANPAAAGS